MRVVLIAALVVAVFLGAGVVVYRQVFGARDAETSWVVSSYSGSVQMRIGGGEWVDVDMKAPLTDGDRIRTGPDGEATLLHDDNQVTVRAATELAISQLNTDSSRFQLDIGQVFVEARGDAVSMRSQSGARVEASDAGLGMTVRADGWTQVKVKRGEADFSAEGETQRLAEGQESEAAAGKPPTTPRPIPQSILSNVRFPDADTFTVQLARVEGRADPGARVRVGDQVVDVGLDGAWAADVPLTEGINQIEVEATDALGTTQVERSQPLRVDTTAPGLSGASFGGRSAGSGGVGLP